MVLILPNLNNGPMEVGLAAAAGDRDDLLFRLAIYPNLEDSLARLPELRNPSAAILRLYRVMAYIVIRHEWYCYGSAIDANVIRVVGEAVPELPIGAWQPDQAWVDSLTANDLANASLLLMATKVNMWQTNHHTGQGAVVGFSAKALRLVFGLSPTDAVPVPAVQAMWVAGHWVSTISAWRRFGVLNCRGPSQGVFDPELWPAPTRDITIRMEAGPAGAASAMTSAAIIRNAVNSVFSVALPLHQGYAELVALPVVVLDATHHVSSLHFTGEPYDELYVVDEELRNIVGCFTHAIIPRTTFAGAKVILSASAVQGMDLFTRLTNLVIAVRANVTDKRTVATLKLMLGGGVTNDPMTAALVAMGRAPRVAPSDDAVDTLMATMAKQGAGAAVVDEVTDA